MKKIMSRRSRQICWTILGSILIVTSTYLIGITSYKLEIDLSEQQEVLNKVIEEIDNSYYAHDMSNIDFNFAHLLRIIIKVSFVQDTAVQNSYEKAYRASIFPVLTRLHDAAGHLLTSEQLKELEMKCDLAVKGDDVKFNELLETSAQLLGESGKYRGDLIVKKAKIQNLIDEINKRVIKTKYQAMVLQILGLMFLLFKEVGDESKKK